jgi:hypothetical protein
MDTGEQKGASPKKPHRISATHLIDGFNDYQQSRTCVAIQAAERLPRIVLGMDPGPATQVVRSALNSEEVVRSGLPRTLTKVVFESADRANHLLPSSLAATIPGNSVLFPHVASYDSITGVMVS